MHINKYKFWKEKINDDNIYYILCFNDNNKIIELIKSCQDEKNKNKWYYTSDFLNIEYDFIIANSINEAKTYFETMILEHLRKNEQMLIKFMKQ